VILVDTSVWIDHLRAQDDALARALDDGEVLTHTFVIGELACGNMRNRGEILGLLQDLPRAREASHEEVMAMLEGRRLMGLGIGYVDAHLIAAAALTPSTSLLTRDKRLSAAASIVSRDLLPTG
jgi:predicted nucleic acid-binding protein